jgi:hypothetical protein
MPGRTNQNERCRYHVGESAYRYVPGVINLGPIDYSAHSEVKLHRIVSASRPLLRNFPWLYETNPDLRCRGRTFTVDSSSLRVRYYLGHRAWRTPFLRMRDYDFTALEKCSQTS